MTHSLSGSKWPFGVCPISGGGELRLWAKSCRVALVFARPVGILCVIGSVVVGSVMVSQAYMCSALDLWSPIAALGIGLALMVYRPSGVDPFWQSLAFLRLCYLIKALAWFVPLATEGGLIGDWTYWQCLVPNAYFCHPNDICAMAIWCMLENLWVAWNVSTLMGRRSHLPFALACLTGLHSLLTVNPLFVVTAIYLLARTGSSSSSFRTITDHYDDGVGFASYR